MKISKYLTLEEATRSDRAKRLSIPNQPNPSQLEAMKYLASEVFDKVREFIGKPLFASSFFRGEELNANTPGASDTSQHTKGEAVDIDCKHYGHGKNIDVFNYIKDNLEWDQLILEYPDEVGNPSWVHVSRKKVRNRQQILVKLKDKYIPFSQYKVGMI
jgi:zinc D-Ala-D-Ala carboxypeptidase